MIRRASNKLLNSLKIFDIFPQEISLTYKGNSRFRTNFSGFCSLIFLSLILIYSLLRFRELLDKSRIYTNQTSKFFNIEIDDIYNITKEDIEVGFSLKQRVDNSYVNLPLEAAYFKTYAQNTYITDTVNGTRDIISKNIDFSPCESTVFEKFVQDNPYIFPDGLDDDSFILGGTRISILDMFGMKIGVTSGNKYNSYSNGFLEELITEKVDNMRMLLRLKSKYIDLKDMDNTFKYYVKDEIISLSKNWRTEVEVSIQIHEYDLSDDIFSISSKKGYFYSISNIKTSQHPLATHEYEAFVEVNFIVDNEIITFQRNVYTLWSLIAEIGGVYQLIAAIGIILFGTYNKYCLTVSLINHKNELLTYSLAEESKIEDENDQKSKNHNKNPYTTNPNNMSYKVPSSSSKMSPTFK